MVTYIIDRNVNYTNVCVTRCKFCNFYRPPGHKEGYTLDKDVLGQKLQETVDLGGVQILLQGGLNPELPLAYYEDLFRWMKANFPLAIHGLSPEEIRYIAEIEQLPLRTVIERLVAAGLDSIPGGGRGDPGRRGPPLHLAAEVLDRDLAGGHAPGARPGPAHHRHHGVRLRRDPRSSCSATWSTCGRCRTRPPASPPSSAGRSRPRAPA